MIKKIAIIGGFSYLYDNKVHLLIGKGSIGRTQKPTKAVILKVTYSVTSLDSLLANNNKINDLGEWWKILPPRHSKKALTKVRAFVVLKQAKPQA